MFRLDTTKNGPFADFGELIFFGEIGQRFEVNDDNSFYLCTKTDEKTCCGCPFLSSDVCRNVACHMKDDNHIKFKEFRRL